MAGLEEARAKGASAVDAVRVTLAERAAEMLRRDPDLAGTAVEVGLVDREWLESPGQHPVRTVAAREVFQRFIERSVERRPSAMGALGLNALQLLAREPSAAEGQRTTTPVTIAFTDLEGFTRYTAQRGDDAAIALLAEHHRAIGPIVRSRGGKVVKRLGDGLMLSFPMPEAAVMAALDLVDVAPEPLRLRAGVHCGLALVTSDDLIGHDVNVAARVTASAKGGQVLVTAAVRDAIGELRGVEFGRARRRSFKGVGDSVSVCPVTRGG